MKKRTILLAAVLLLALNLAGCTGNGDTQPTAETASSETKAPEGAEMPAGPDCGNEVSGSEQGGFLNFPTADGTELEVPDSHESAENHADNEPMDPSLLETAAPTNPAPIDGTAEVVTGPGPAGDFLSENIAGLYLYDYSLESTGRIYHTSEHATILAAYSDDTRSQLHLFEDDTYETEYYGTSENVLDRDTDFGKSLVDRHMTTQYFCGENDYDDLEEISFEEDGSMSFYDGGDIVTYYHKAWPLSDTALIDRDDEDFLALESDINDFLHTSPANGFLADFFASLDEFDICNLIYQAQDEEASEDDLYQALTAEGPDFAWGLTATTPKYLDEQLELLTGYGLYDRNWKSSAEFYEPLNLYYYMHGDTNFTPGQAVLLAVDGDTCIVRYETQFCYWPICHVVLNRIADGDYQFRAVL